MPDGLQPGHAINVANDWPAGRKHPNGGGWVASAARVDPTACVGPNATVLGGQVLGNARIEDYAMVWNGAVRDTAVVGVLAPARPQRHRGRPGTRVVGDGRRATCRRRPR